MTQGRRPGRPRGSALLNEQEDIAPDVPKGKRRKRGSLSAHKMKLEAPQRKGYVRHWVNDSGNRINDLYDRDFEFVEDKEIHSHGEGTRVKRRVGTKEDGSALYAYLMEIPEEYHREDQKEKMKPLDEFNEALLRGEAERKPGDGLHVERIKVETST